MLEINNLIEQLINGIIYQSNDYLPLIIHENARV